MSSIRNTNKSICGDALQNIFTIPAGIPFAKALASRLLEEHADKPETLPDILILLPTRRACRTVREAFLQLNGGKPIMLPAMQALGDIDEEELSISIAGQEGTQQFLELPAVLPSMQRQILLARAILQHEDFPHGFDQALSLAKTLCHLLDQIYTEDLDIRDLVKIVPEDFADHWQITLDFLKILSEAWPQILNDMNVIDAADRRNRLINALSNFWDQTKPKQRIIAAGTTGSIPATAKLLKTIANLPNGQIILPGLDENIDDMSWENLSESHPQYGFKHLLEVLGRNKEDIATWPTTLNDNDISIARRILSSELMRPAETTKEWQAIKDKPEIISACKTATQNLELFNCDTPQHEAQIIATLMRQTLEEPTKTAALITPDRNLAKRVAMACRRWGITIDDSAGEALNQTPIGRFLMLTIEACTNALSPVSLLALLKHKLAQKELKENLGQFETLLLRGFKPPKGIAGLEHQWEKNGHNESLRPLIDKLSELFTPLLNIFESDERVDFKSLMLAHITLCEALHDSENLWSGEDGNAASSLLSELLEHAHVMPNITPHEYPAILQQFMASITLRPAFGTHPRLQILGQLEARLIDADLVILSGLNEGTWPPDPGHDPWMSRPMRSEFGLPGSERSIGLSSHDFIQGLCSPKVAITRSKLKDGAPTVPARWLGRLETVLNAADIDPKTLSQSDITTWVHDLDTADTLEPYTRPAPKPPISVRPTKLPITKIETWLKDPYSIYAYSILGLRTLDPLEKEADAAIRGDMLHESLHEFITQHPDHIPNNAAKFILAAAQDFINRESLNEEDWHFYWPRFTKITDGFLSKEHEWREQAKPLKTEIKGEMKLSTTAGDFTLYGRADRIDQTEDGTAIIDYKSGGSFSKTGMTTGDTPQLPLEALIVQEGGFEEIPATPCTYLGYWVLNGNNKHTELTDPHNMLVDTKASLITLIETFADEQTPYYAIPRSNKIPRFNDYEHLARIKEWAALDDSESEAA
jgi:ATP-dependent helicase/nuclease subunit B